MTDNISVLDASSTTQTVKTTDTAGVHVPHKNIDIITAGSVDIAGALPAGDNNIGNVDVVTMPSDTFAADAQAYGKGVLVQGDDGTDRRALLVGTDGHLQADVLNTVTVSGTVTANAGTGSFDVNLQDGGGTDLTSTTVSADRALDVNVVQSATVTVSGSVEQATHDNFNVNANIQQGDADVAAGNALYVQAGTGATFKLAESDGTDIGNVDVASVVPGTAATNLGKAEDAAHTTGDVGVMAMGVRFSEAQSLVSASGDYVPFGVSDHGAVHVNVKHHKVLVPCSSSDGFTALNSDTLNIAETTRHVCGTKAVEFDKVNGAANTVYGCVQKTITAHNFLPYSEGGGFILWNLYLSSVSDVDYAFIRLGTDGSNYNEWRIQGTDLSADWNNIRVPILRSNAAGATGDGWNSLVVTYVALGVAFDNQTDTLADIAIDRIAVNSGIQTSADITAAVSSEVSSPNVNVKKWNVYTVDTDQGNAGTGTLRVAIADDDTNLAEINTSASLLSDAIAAEGAALVKGVLIQGDDGTDRTNVLVDTSGHLQIDVITGSTSIDDGGNTITVDGTVTANAGTGTFTVSGSVDVTTPTAASAMHVQGAAAEDASASGNPVLAGGRYDSSPRTLDDGDAGAIALDADGAVQISDGGNTITVDGTVTANAGTGTFTVSGSVDVAGALPTGTNNIGDVDVASMPSDTFAADAQAYGKGVLVQGDDGSDRRALLVGTDGHLQVDVLAAPTTTVTGSVSVTTPVAASAMHIQGTTAEDASASGNPVLAGGRYDSSPRTLDDGDAGAIALDADGAVHVSDGGNTITVDGAVTVSGSVDVVTPTAASAMHIQGAAAEDVSASGNPVLAGGRYDSSPRTLDDGDVGAIALDADGAVQISDGGHTITVDGAVTISGSVETTGALPAGNNNIGNVDIVTMPADTFAADAQAYGKGVLVQGDDGSDRRALLVGTDGHLQVDVLSVPSTTVSGSVSVITPVAASAMHVQGTTAHDAAASGNPVLFGGYAEQTRPAAVADGDAARAWFDTLGRQTVQIGTPITEYKAGTYAASQANTAFVAGSAGVRLCIFDILVSTGTAGSVLFEDGTACTLFGNITLAANGGWSFNSSVGVRLTAGCSLTLSSCTGTGPLAVTVNYGVLPTL